MGQKSGNYIKMDQQPQNCVKVVRKGKQLIYII